MAQEYQKKRQRSEFHDNRNNKRQQSDNQQTFNLQQCSLCSRYFIENRLFEHQQACKQSKKLQLNPSHRYHYDSQLHRWKGLDYNISLIQSNDNRKKLQSISTKHFPHTHWREKRQQFQNILKGQYNPIESSDDHPYQCSLCQRKFATEIAITKHRKGCTGHRQRFINSNNTRNKNVR